MQDLSLICHWCSWVDFSVKGMRLGLCNRRWCMWLKAVTCVAATQLCLDFSRGNREGGGDRLAGCFQSTPDFTFFRMRLEMGIYMCTGWYFKITAVPHLKESKPFTVNDHFEGNSIICVCRFNMVL